MKKFLLIAIVLLLNAKVCAQKQSFEKDSLITSYQTFGAGDPVLIINGGPGMNSNGFEELAELLSENNKIIIYDQRGTGGSKMPHINRSNMTIDLMAQDIEDLREHLGFEEWTILGHSFGGILAYEYAAKYPDRVRAMIQSHSGGMRIDLRNEFDVREKLTRSQLDSLNHYTVKIAMGDTSEETALKRAEFLAPAYLHDNSLAGKIAPRLTEVNRMINSYIWNDLRSKQFDRTNEMKNFQKPVLILHGESEIVPLEIAKYAHETLPKSKLVVMKDCGHYGWLEKPEIYLKEVKDFLNAQSGSGNP